MTFQQLLKKFRTQLAGIYSRNEIDNVFFLLLEYYLNYSKTDFYLCNHQLMNADVHSTLNQALSRLKNFEPVQYITGEAWFMNHSYYVNEHVLIPRSETEEVFDIIRTIKPKAQSAVDLGTGSGCIAIELSKLMNMPVDATDIDPKSIETAQKNIERHHANVTVFQADLLHYNPEHYSLYDIVVSNPPYVQTKEKKHMHNNVLNYEPKKALFVPDNDPLIFYKAISQIAFKHLKKHGLVAL